ncbi:hypothetical protein FQA39_LY18148 [Lamprigera yunnana]|nr:hypothetical protein FQA39_LY18148 [Lamprigera yunnana]
MNTKSKKGKPLIEQSQTTIKSEPKKAAPKKRAIVMTPAKRQLRKARKVKRLKVSIDRVHQLRIKIQAGDQESKKEVDKFIVKLTARKENSKRRHRLINMYKNMASELLIPVNSGMVLGTNNFKVGGTNDSFKMEIPLPEKPLVEEQNDFHNNQPPLDGGPKPYRDKPANQRNPNAPNQWRNPARQSSSGKQRKAVPSKLPPPTPRHDASKAQISSVHPSEHSVFASNMQRPRANTTPTARVWYCGDNEQTPPLPGIPPYA